MGLPSGPSLGDLEKAPKQEMMTKPRCVAFGAVLGILAVTILLPLVKAAILASVLPLILLACGWIVWKVLR